MTGKCREDKGAYFSEIIYSLTIFVTKCSVIAQTSCLATCLPFQVALCSDTRGQPPPQCGQAGCSDTQQWTVNKTRLQNHSTQVLSAPIFNVESVMCRFMCFTLPYFLSFTLPSTLVNNSGARTIFCVCVCVCVWEREREGEGEREREREREKDSDRQTDTQREPESSL